MAQSTSIIIAAHNEAENLKANLPFILNQQNVEFEVIVINDRSTDNTKEVLNSFQDERLRILNITDLPNDISGKKNALTQAIKIAKYENLLFTDADCKPNSEDWASKMVKQFNQNDLVLGVSQYKNSGSFLSEFIQFETLFTAIQYLGFAKLGMPYMGIGRNIAYKKSLFTTNNGFSSHKEIIGGDDDLFVGEVARNAKIALCTSFDSQTISEPKPTWEAYFKQKRRHLSVGLKYNWKMKLLVGLFQQFRLWWFLATIFSLFILPLESNFALKFFIFVKIAEWLIFWYSKRKLRFNVRLYLFPIYDVIYSIYFLITGLSVLFVKNNKW